MTQASAQGSGDGEQHFEGVGASVDAALHDAILVANRSSDETFGFRAEVVAWGVEAIGIGGARSFWVRVKRTSAPR